MFTYKTQQLEDISPDIKFYGLQSFTVISTLQWPDYALFYKTVTILNIFFFNFLGSLLHKASPFASELKSSRSICKGNRFLVRHSNTEAHHKEHETFPSPPTPPPPPSLATHLHQCNLYGDCTLVYFLVEREKKPYKSIYYLSTPDHYTKQGMINKEIRWENRMDFFSTVWGHTHTHTCMNVHV